MKAELPTEEDVLAFLVLNSALGLMMVGDPDSIRPLRDAIDNWQKSEEYSVALEAAAHARLYAHDRIHTAAIADSERRLDCERARDAVVDAVAEWLRGEPRGTLHLIGTFHQFRIARARAEVSRHGG